MRLQIISKSYVNWFVLYPLLNCNFLTRFDDGSPRLLCFDINHIRYQFWCTRCAFRQIMSLQWCLNRNVGNPNQQTKGLRWVWPVSRGCLLLHGTWFCLRFCRRSVLPYTRFCMCFWTMITFNTLLLRHFIFKRSIT